MPPDLRPRMRRGKGRGPVRAVTKGCGPESREGARGRTRVAEAVARGRFPSRARSPRPAGCHGERWADHDGHDGAAPPGVQGLNFVANYSLLLIGGALLALVWANVDASSYHHFVEYPLFFNDLVGFPYERWETAVGAEHASHFRTARRS